MLLSEGGGKGTILKYPQSTLFLTGPAIRRNYFTRTYYYSFIRSYPTWGKKNTQGQAALSICPTWEGRKPWTYEAHSSEAQDHGKIGIWSQDDRMLPFPPVTHHHIAKGLFTAVSFVQFITSSYQERITRHTKRFKKKRVWKDKASEPESDMVEMLEISDQEFKTTITSIC